MKSGNNRTEGETLAFILIAQHTKRQHESTMLALKPYYRLNHGVIEPTRQGLNLLNVKQPSSIWKAHTFLSGLGYKLSFFPTKRREIVYHHPSLPQGSPCRDVKFVDRERYTDLAGRVMAATYIKHEVIKWTQ